MIGNWSVELNRGGRRAGKPRDDRGNARHEPLKLLFERLTREDFEFKEFVNSDALQVTYGTTASSLKRRRRARRRRRRKPGSDRS